jgi:hypothetical protein
MLFAKQQLWFYRLYVPDLKAVETDQAVKALSAALEQMEWRLVGYRIKAIILLIPIGLVFLAADQWSARRTDVWSWLGAISFGVLIVLIMALELWLARHELRYRVRKQLNRLGRPVCTACGYDMRSTRTRCPECGAPWGSPFDPKHTGDA